MGLADGILARLPHGTREVRLRGEPRDAADSKLLVERGDMGGD